MLQIYLPWMILSGRINEKSRDVIFLNKYNIEKIKLKSRTFYVSKIATTENGTPEKVLGMQLY